MTDHLTPHIALTILRENILEVSDNIKRYSVLHFTTTPINEFLHQLYKQIILPGVQANTKTLAHLNMASMGIHLTCAIDSILFKMTQVWLPPPMPPSDRLLAAVEAFYSPPSHDRPRNRYMSKLWF
ncbi:hypothetical protein XENOCAPTIV_015743 [Xenoophorus captivus]|uniref:DUF7819 domain-containing protein n=1 Tax=Xenoophorus captivus TaxID=1517983 RepID=A0ABV0S7R0_9TELE